MIIGMSITICDQDEDGFDVWRTIGADPIANGLYYPSDDNEYLLEWTLIPEEWRYEPHPVADPSEVGEVWESSVKRSVGGTSRPASSIEGGIDAQNDACGSGGREGTAREVWRDGDSCPAENKAGGLTCRGYGKVWAEGTPQQREAVQAFTRAVRQGADWFCLPCRAAFTEADESRCSL